MNETAQRIVNAGMGAAAAIGVAEMLDETQVEQIKAATSVEEIQNVVSEALHANKVTVEENGEPTKEINETQ